MKVYIVISRYEDKDLILATFANITDALAFKSEYESKFNRDSEEHLYIAEEPVRDSYKEGQIESIVFVDDTDDEPKEEVNVVYLADYKEV